ncbi:hypothetical protein DVH24_032893 [Malus domestica]|uniref:SWIM-type domain-containing protein n=1 Tax=Malus domestica TaxID=3750 RepID=A0A498IN72_MALDO|nr:hypothetical protein DVH24_032893 [Malus domestica]
MDATLKVHIQERFFNAFDTLDDTQMCHYTNGGICVLKTKHTCKCRRWDLTGIPCAHGIAAIYRKEDDPYKCVHSCYKKAAYLRA